MYLTYMTPLEKLMEELNVENGLQKYQYVVDSKLKVIGIDCLLCGSRSYHPKDVNDQWCERCEVHHYTPS